MSIFPFKGSSAQARAAKYAADLAIWTLVVPAAFFLRQAFDYTGLYRAMLLGLPVKFAIIYFSRLERRSWTRSTS